MQYFGTDGIRHKSKKLMKIFAIKVAFALYKLKAKSVVVGYDQRPSSKKILNQLSKGCLLLGIRVLNAGVVPSACVSYLNVINNTDFGIIITASHNSAKINGIKLFKSNGEKLNVLQEKEIEKLFALIPNKNIIKHLQRYAKNVKIKKEKKTKTSLSPYLNLLKQHTPCLKDKTIVLDCANGASKYLAKKVFLNTKANLIILNTKSGRKINKNCGAVHPEYLSTQVLKHKANIGFAFDGDADRCVAVLSNGTVLSGDNTLFAIAKHYKFSKVVGTIYSNGAIDKALKNKAITFHRSFVGDQAVKKMMNKTKCAFGGERSGHFIFSQILPTGDGMLSALKITNIKNLEKISSFKKIPSKSINIATKQKNWVLKNIKGIKAKYEKLLGKSGRVIIRASGTEDIVRVLIEHKNPKKIELIEKLLLDKIRYKK